MKKFGYIKKEFLVMNERQIIIKHALTVLAGQLAVVSFGVADTIIAGRYDPHALAILSVSAAIYITVYVGLLGILQAMLPIFAELYGAKKFLDIGKVFRQSLYVWFGLTLLGVVFLTSPDLLLQWTNVPSELHQQSISYLSILALALAPTLFFRLFSALSQSLGKPRWVTWIQIIGLMVKIPLSVLMTFGYESIPAMGLAGCAFATVLVNYSMMAVALWMLRTQEIYTRCGIWAKPEKPHWPEIKNIFSMGIPNGLSVTVEVTSFTLMALFISRLGTSAAASHQIASNMAAFLYMIPLSFSIAISARISYWRGAAQFEKMKQSMNIGFQVTMSLAFCMMLILLVLHEPLANLYSKDLEVVNMASSLLILIGLYHFVDALQTLCFFVLRSFKVTFAPALVYSTVLWGVGLLGGYQLSYEGIGNIEAMNSANAFWIMNIIGLIMVCACLISLIRLSLKQQLRDQTVI